jgi:hypothetical protein
MPETPLHSSRPGEQTTLGRMGGLAPGEADSGGKTLWLAGGGYRAALFHLGALTRLNELGILAGTATVGAVAGGSIVAALLAARVPWPLHGGFREWPERVAEPMRAIARRNVRARALMRRPFPGGAGGAALEEGYARDLVRSLGGEPEQGPRFVFGASGLILSGLAAGWEDCVEWNLAGATAAGYGPQLVAEAIAAVRTDLDAFAEAEQAVLENHGYLLADAAARERGLTAAGGIELGPPLPPHPRWMNEERVHEALAASARRSAVGRLRPRRANRGGRRSQPASVELTALLQRHRPLLRYDSLESFRADSAVTICELADGDRCNSLHRADGTPIAAAAPSGDLPRLELDFLGESAYANGEPTDPGDYLDECGASHAADALAMRRREGCGDVVYGHARHDRAGRLWLQYWFFHYFADKGLLGLEQREGDWEMVQLRLGDGVVPDAATFARHGGAERLGWDEAELADGDQGPAIVVYPARGSHAPLPRPGSFAAPSLPDHSDGLGPRLRPELAAIGDDGPGWVRWPGRWGSTRRREFFEADSPRGPRGQPQWWEPDELHREARPWADTAAAGRRPPRPHLEVRREGGLAIVAYRFGDPGEGEEEPARFVAAPCDAEGEDPCLTRPLAIEGREGSFSIQLPAGRTWSGVRASVASGEGVFGDTLVADFE